MSLTKGDRIAILAKVTNTYLKEGKVRVWLNFSSDSVFSKENIMLIDQQRMIDLGLRLGSHYWVQGVVNFYINGNINFFPDDTFIVETITFNESYLTIYKLNKLKDMKMNDVISYVPSIKGSNIFIMEKYINDCNEFFHKIRSSGFYADNADVLDDIMYCYASYRGDGEHDYKGLKRFCDDYEKIVEDIIKFIHYEYILGSNIMTYKRLEDIPHYDFCISIIGKEREEDIIAAYKKIVY